MRERRAHRGAWISAAAALLTPALALAHVDQRPRGDAESPALAEATRAWQSLSADKRHRERRDLWNGVIARLQRIGRDAGSGETRALASLRAAEAAEDMANIARTKKDYERADELLRKVAQASDGAVADEASRHAARLEKKHLGGEREEPAVHHETAAPKADEPRQKNDELRSITSDWEKLKTDSKRREFRDRWEPIIARFSALAERLVPVETAALAGLRAAQTAEDLSLVSRHRSDAEHAVALYLRVHRHFPDTASAAQALTAAARIEIKRLDEEKTAREHLLLARRTKGADAAAIEKLLALLPAETEHDAPPPAAAPTTPAATTPASPPPAPAVAASAAEPGPAPVDDHADALGKLIAGIDLARSAPPLPPEVKAKDVRHLRQSALADSSLSLSEQVGLKVHRIIIDAGHGGHDTGAVGPGGTREKDVTLAVARELARDLKGRGYEIVLTRNTDDFVALEERTAIANKDRGDLFVSIHANASPSRSLTGVETYSLNVASNRYSMRLAARENATSEGSVSDLQYVLADLATRANTVDSDRLARCVQTAVVDGVARKYGRPRDNGVKHALFYVLLGTRMPAILVETQFISNRREEKRLGSASYQAVVARSIASGIDQFVSRRQQLASVER
jgi:N-acetylmuramoyl-L-alanine amidase